MYDGVAVGKIRAEKHDSIIVPGDFIVEIQYVGVVTCDVVENVIIQILVQFFLLY
jgi:hypothetical protein